MLFPMRKVSRQLALSLSGHTKKCNSWLENENGFPRARQRCFSLWAVLLQNAFVAKLSCHRRTKWINI
jgi:hypothetical protein